MKLSGEGVLKRFEKAKGRRSVWESLWEDIYELCIPGREGFYASVPGESRTDEIFDMTAPNALAEFASRMQSGMTPAFQNWFRFEPGYEIPAESKKKLQGELDEVSAAVWEVLANSNFQTEGQELMTDLGVGWGTQAIDDGRDGQIVTFKTIPQSQCFWDNGPFGQPDGVFRVRQSVKIKQLEVIWPKAKVSDELKRKAESDPDATVNLVEACYRDWDADTVRYCYQIVVTADKSILVDEEYTGLGSRPLVTPRWNVAAGEVYGRGPLVQALPSIRVLNLVQEMVLEHGQMAISGIWQVDEDGVINVDNIEIVPGTVYARAADSRGLERTDINGGSFDVSQLIIANMQSDVKRALLSEDLGSLERTPRSATEVQARLQNVADQIGGAYGRLWNEWITPTLQRVVYLLERSGKIAMPKLDGRQVRVVAKSPLARAQKFEEVERIRGFAGDLIGIAGPQMAQLYIDQDKLVDLLQRNWEVDAKLVRPEAARKQLMETMTEAAGMAQEAGPEQQQVVNG